MLFSLEQAFVGRDEKRALLTTPAWEAIQGPEIRKSFEEAQRTDETKHNKAVLVIFKCVQWLCMARIPLVKFKLRLELLHDLGLDSNHSKTWS